MIFAHGDSVAISGTLNTHTWKDEHSSLPGNFVGVPLCEVVVVFCFFRLPLQIHANVFLFRNADSGGET